MTPEQQKAFEDRIAMCGSPGWADLMEELAEFKTTLNNIAGIKTIEEVCVRQGKIELIQWMESLSDVSRETYESLKNESD